MPVTKSAKKKLRQDKKRTIQNKLFRFSLKETLKKATKSPTEKSIMEAFSIVDKASNKYIFHKNKAARIKSSLTKLLGKKIPKKTTSGQKKNSTRKPNK